MTEASEQDMQTKNLVGPTVDKSMIGIESICSLADTHRSEGVETKGYALGSIFEE